MKTLGNKSLSAIFAKIINIIWWVEWLMSGAIILVGLTTAIVKKEFAVDIPITFSAVTLKQLSSVNKNFPGGMVSAINGNLHLFIHATWLNVVVLLIAFAAIASVIIIITFQLKMIFSNLRNNMPFNDLNALRIRNIAIILIAYSVIQWLAVVALNQILISNLNWEEMNLTYSFNFSCLAMGITLFIVSEIFKLGTSLEEDKNLTI